MNAQVKLVTHDDGVRAVRDGVCLGVAWGPACASDDWFVLVYADGKAQRVESRKRALAILRGIPVEVTR